MSREDEDEEDWEVLIQRAEAHLVHAEKALDNITGWSGGAGNWPAQDAHPRVRAALAALRGEGKE